MYTHSPIRNVHVGWWFFKPTANDSLSRRTITTEMVLHVSISILSGILVVISSGTNMNIIETYRQLKDYYPELRLEGLDTPTITISAGEDVLLSSTGYARRDQVNIFLSGMLSGVLLRTN